MPEVTVILPVYNGMPYLPEAVDSILGQTFSDFKLLIINDGSTDGSSDYLDSIKDPRVEVVNQSNKGLGATLNTGIEMCETEYLARMDADDISLPERFERQLNYLRRHPEVGALGAQIKYFFDKSRSGFSPSLYLENSQIYNSLLNMEHGLCHGSCVFKTSVLRAVGGYKLQGIGEDHDLYLRMGESAKLANLEEILYLVRLHDKSIVWSNWRECRRNYAYASHSARRRSEGLPEISLDSFIAEHYPGSFWRNAVERIDAVSNIQYRKAIRDALKGRKITATMRTLLATLCAPARAWGRLKREASRFYK